MSATYRVIVSGEPVEGMSVAEVRAALLKAVKQDAATVDRMLAGCPVVVKRGADAATAEKYRQVLSGCGVLCHIEEEAAEGPVNGGEEERPPAATGSSEPLPQKPVGSPEPARSVRTVSWRGMRFEYDFAVVDLLREAWQRTAGVKGAFFGAFALLMLVSIVLNLISMVLLHIFGVGEEQVAIATATEMTLSVALYPFLAGVMMMGIHRAVDLPVHAGMVFGYFQYMVPILIAAFLTTVLTSVGYFLLLIPGIYLSVAYLFAIPLIVDQGMGAWEAMETSRRAVTHRWFKIFGLYLVMGLIMILSALPIGIGLIWTMPMMTILTGILYRIIFGAGDAFCEEPAAP